MKINILSATIATALLALSYTSNSYAEWKYGIGTGISRLNVEGDISVESALGGTIKLPVDLDPDEIDDLMESAIGFAGYATDGTWMVTYSYVNLELEGTSVVGAVSAKANFEATLGELIVGYPITKTQKFSSNVLFGVRYLAHDLKSQFTSGATTLSNQRDNDWIDGVIGITADFKLTDILTWNNQLDASGGESEGIANFKTALNWRVSKKWTVGLNAKFSAVEVKNGNPGDADYYVYDADETSAGASFLYHF